MTVSRSTVARLCFTACAIAGVLEARPQAIAAEDPGATASADERGFEGDESLQSPFVNSPDVLAEENFSQPAIDLDCPGCATGDEQPFPYYLGTDASGRHRGRGQPLEQASWRNRPFGISGFVGGLFADDPISNRIDAGAGFFLGTRLTWDFDHHWGFETRAGGSVIGLEDPLYLEAPGRNVQLGDMNLFFCDINWLYYPWGDARWRPYTTFGLGLVDIDFFDDLGQREHETLFGIPFGLGVKYRWDSRWAFRFDFQDNVAFGGGNRLSNMHNLSLTSGLEWRFGGVARKSYWPWNPSRSWW